MSESHATESLLARRRRKDLARIVGPAGVDIVTDLRAWCSDMHGPADRYACLFCGAADEIDRLRAALATAGAAQ